MTKQQANNVLKAAYRDLRTGDITVVFKKFKRDAGRIMFDESLILLNPKRDILATFLHEYGHHRNPQANEKTIKAWEKEIVNHLSERQYRNLFKLLAAVLR